MCSGIVRYHCVDSVHLYSVYRWINLWELMLKIINLFEKPHNIPIHLLFGFARNVLPRKVAADIFDFDQNFDRLHAYGVFFRLLKWQYHSWRQFFCDLVAGRKISSPLRHYRNCMQQIPKDLNSERQKTQNQTVYDYMVTEPSNDYSLSFHPFLPFTKCQRARKMFAQSSIVEDSNCLRSIKDTTLDK